jgi:hypothetical protein
MMNKQDSLAELALDLRWSWNHGADEVWRRLDPTLWALTQNPWVVLQTVSRDKLERVTSFSFSRFSLIICEARLPPGSPARGAISSLDDYFPWSPTWTSTNGQSIWSMARWRWRSSTASSKEQSSSRSKARLIAPRWSKARTIRPERGSSQLLLSFCAPPQARA